jgi:hypothetical protein
MKVRISNYRHHWVSPYTILERLFWWKPWAKDDGPPYPEWVERWADRLTPVSLALQTTLDWLRPRVEYVRIDHWDTWSMDHTLAYIVLPMLRQLKATKHGAPAVDDEDVPEHLRSTAAPPRENDYDVDALHFDRWDWVLDEMIWAFEQKVDDRSDDQFYDHSGVDSNAPFMEQIKHIHVDRQGLDAWQARKSNGYRLFGKYYEALWD